MRPSLVARQVIMLRYPLLPLVASQAILTKVHLHPLISPRLTTALLASILWISRFIKQQTIHHTTLVMVRNPESSNQLVYAMYAK